MCALVVRQKIEMKKKYEPRVQRKAEAEDAKDVDKKLAQEDPGKIAIMTCKLSITLRFLM